MFEMMLDNVVVNAVFRKEVKFVENLDGHRTYLQDNEEIAVIIHLIDEDITKELMETMQVGCEFEYFIHGQRKVNMYILAENCRVHVNEYEMPSEAEFTIMLAVTQ